MHGKFVAASSFAGPSWYKLADSTIHLSSLIPYPIYLIRKVIWLIIMHCNRTCAFIGDDRYNRSIVLYVIVRPPADEGHLVRVPEAERGWEHRFLTLPWLNEESSYCLRSKPPTSRVEIVYSWSRSHYPSRWVSLLKVATEVRFLSSMSVLIMLALGVPPRLLWHFSTVL